MQNTNKRKADNLKIISNNDIKIEGKNKEQNKNLNKFDTYKKRVFLEA